TRARTQIHAVLRRHPALALAAVAPRPNVNTQHDTRLSLQLRDVLHSSSASMSDPTDIASSVWA
ncbi:hypothetical protein KUDE01_008553, partial [Dissostichus eleginoides]